jgi:hypothetical protein
MLAKPALFSKRFHKVSLFWFDCVELDDLYQILSRFRWRKIRSGSFLGMTQHDIC